MDAAAKDPVIINNIIWQLHCCLQRVCIPIMGIVFVIIIFQVVDLYQVHE